jgi:polar amino acid transport system substrate-binding protein
MTPLPRARRVRRAAAALGLALLAGCSGAAASSTAAAHPVAVDRVLHDSLPKAVRDRGELRVVTDASYAPASSFGPDGRTIIGFEPDLGNALGAVLGVRVVFANQDFDALPALVRTHKADLVMSAMTDTTERERALDFVDYFSAGSSIVVQRGNPAGISGISTLCGHTVAVQRGTVQVDLLRNAAKNCDNGPLRITTWKTNDDALVQLRTGRADAVLNDYPPAAALTSAPATAAHYQLASTAQYEPGAYGIGVAKDAVDLRNALQGALQHLVDSGEYVRVLKHWGVADGAVSTATINAGAALTS